MHHHFQQHSHRIHDYVSLSSEHLLTGVIATRPPFSVVFTDWLSIIAAVGIALLPSLSRTFGRNASCTRSHVPSSEKRLKYLYTVCHGGRSCGSIRQAHPVRSTYRMALSTSLKTSKSVRLVTRGEQVISPVTWTRNTNESGEDYDLEFWDSDHGLSVEDKCSIEVPLDRDPDIAATVLKGVVTEVSEQKAVIRGTPVFTIGKRTD